MSLLVVGSVALDSIETAHASHAELLGGSATYAAVAASFSGPVGLVGVVGDDFPKEHIRFLEGRGIDLGGLRKVAGRTFRWSGRYHADMNQRTTLSTELGVFESFSPEIPESFRDAEFVLLANIGPALQARVLDQVRGSRFVIADTMNLWISIAREDLVALLKRVDMLVLNDEEARQLTGESSLIKAGRALLDFGPRAVAVKKGEHGCLLFGAGGDYFTCGAFPLEEIQDPTGAGDTFVGALAGHLAKENPPEVGFDALRRAVVHGSVMASYNVESFSLERLRSLSPGEVQEREAAFARMLGW